MSLDFYTIPRKRICAYLPAELHDRIMAQLAVQEGQTITKWLAEALWDRAHAIETNADDWPKPPPLQRGGGRAPQRNNRRRDGGGMGIIPTDILVSTILAATIDRQKKRLNEGRSLYICRAAERRLRQCTMSMAMLTRFKLDAYNAMYPNGHEKLEENRTA